MEEETANSPTMEEATAEYRFQDQGSRLPFARGGPVYVPDRVGPITSVPEFMAAALQELQSLEADLATSGDFDDELSVNELKIFSEEELVEKALKDEFEDIPGIGDSSQPSGHASEEMANDCCISGKEIVCSGNSAVENSNSGSCLSLNKTSTRACGTDVSEERVQGKKRKKRGRLFDRNSRAAELEGNYFAKVMQLAKIKQKQDEDKLAARLHSFCGNSKPAESTISSSEKIERMRSLRFITSPVKDRRNNFEQLFRHYHNEFSVKSLNSQEQVPLCYPEVILCVEIYHNKSNSLKTQEFLVLGSQRLTDLRDNIYCLTDRLMQTAGEHDSSGYFLIEDTFCNDLRDPSAIDYSKPIFDWLQNCKNEAAEKWEHIMSGELKKKQRELLGSMDISSLPKFKAVNMHRIQFSELKFRLGATYIYCHQGNCKHNVVIRDMRLIHPEDVQNKADYPLLTFQLRPRHRKCSVCRIYLATKMIIDDKWSPKNPCYLCINCYFLLHYKEDNSLLYPHVVFDYYHE